MKNENRFLRILKSRILESKKCMDTFKVFGINIEDISILYFNIEGSGFFQHKTKDDRCLVSFIRKRGHLAIHDITIKV